MRRSGQRQARRWQGHAVPARMRLCGDDCRTDTVSTSYFKIVGPQGVKAGTRRKTGILKGSVIDLPAHRVRGHRYRQLAIETKGGSAGAPQGIFIFDLLSVTVIAFDRIGCYPASAVCQVIRLPGVLRWRRGDANEACGAE